MRIIGITGTLGAGKGTVVEYLVSHKGFAYYSAREFIIEEIKKRGLPINRDMTTMVANELRRDKSTAYIVEMLYNRAAARGADAVIESIRNPGEVAFLREQKNFYLFAVDADPRLRYERVVQRGSETDHISFEKFLEDEAREMESQDPTKQNIRWCVEQADFTLTNNGTREDLQAAVETALKKMVE